MCSCPQKYSSNGWFTRTELRIVYVRSISNLPSYRSYSIRSIDWYILFLQSQWEFNRGKHQAMSLYKLKASVTYFNWILHLRATACLHCHCIDDWPAGRYHVNTDWQQLHTTPLGRTEHDHFPLMPDIPRMRTFSQTTLTIGFISMSFILKKVAYSKAVIPSL